MRALVVGAGAVGRVLAHHLARGGADVTFLVKRRHADEARRGFPLATGKTCAIVRARVVTESAELDPIDAIFLCVPSTALADDAWLRAIARATGDASIVAFGPGLDDAARVTDACGRARTVIGALGLMAWAVPAGTAYWVPPLAGVSLTGDALRVATIAAALARGGLRAKAHRDAAGVAATGAALLESIAAGLRVAGWSRRMLRRDRALTALVASSAREAIAIGAAARDATPPAFARALGPHVIDLVLAGLATLAPIDVDRFFALHYTKLAAQSRASLDAWSERARSLGLPSAALDELRARTAEVARAA